MEAAPTLKLIPLEPFPEGKCQRASSKDDRFNQDSQYLVKINDFWYAGQFSEVWYGWSFDNWGMSGMQLNSIDGPIYEIIERPPL